MGLEGQPLLKEEDVRAAERREGVFAVHPVILILDKYAEEINGFNRRYGEVKEAGPANAKAKEAYLKDKGVFLVEALFEAAPYTLAPLESVAHEFRTLM